MLASLLTLTLSNTATYARRVVDQIGLHTETSLTELLAIPLRISCAGLDPARTILENEKLAQDSATS
jgi:hypothetical protein